MNSYAYCGNNPIVVVDPLGLSGLETGTVVVASKATWGYMTAAGTFISGGTVVALGAGAAVVGGAAGYGIYKVAVEPTMDWFVNKKLYDWTGLSDPVATACPSPQIKKRLRRDYFEPTRKRAKDLARQLGHQAPQHDGAHVEGGREHWHPIDRNGKRIKGGHVFHPEVVPFLLWPDDTEAKATDKEGLK